ncbi:IPT/TIG domain-containing protein [Nocardia aurantia]|uniref:IPT/TIG domain-containing protein n=1 Tax=Nocardia aurantia TaxID=2585199 RepID=A0A7K0DZK2_9NOCA|nr:IPT/TIG domain-containing protein [Nocardia aurantia]MQY30702.1 hypothetical protein [Nocardia aurantia]
MPTITSISPTSGPALGGTSVTITGTGFTGVLAVRFGILPALFIVNSATQITAVAPPGLPGTAQVSVIGLTGISNNVPYTYVAAPVLTGISPHSGPVTGGTTVVLTGLALTGATAVNFGGTPATSFTVDSATQITAVTPAGPAGLVPVTVTTPGGTSNGLPFSYAAAPTLVAITPPSGRATGGTTVVLTGTALNGATAVSFGGTPATSFTVVSPTQITAVTPAGAAGTVAVTVTTPGGTSNGIPFTYIAAPTLTAITPATGPITGATVVVLTGTGLTGATAVHFGLLPALSFTVDSATQITAVTPPGLGTVAVTVTTAGGTVDGVSYTYA